MLRMNESATRLKGIESSESLLKEVPLSLVLSRHRDPFTRLKWRFPLSLIAPFHGDAIESDACFAEMTL